MKVEYLIVTQQDDSFCDDETSFNNLLQANTQIIIEHKKLLFTQNKKLLEVDYGLETDIIKNKKQRYFHIKLTANDDSQIELFTLLIRTIKKIVERLNSNISVNSLWDGISRHYIIQAYPLINEVENVMRKLILKFMLVNVGMDWADERITSELKTKISTRAEQNNAKTFREDALHNADFIQLSSILFDKKRDKDLNQLDSLLSKNKKGDTITFGELTKDFYPVSNWDRYFSKLIKYEGKLLEEKWKELSDLRNKIAHNKNFSKAELETVKKLHNEIIAKLNEAITELDKVELDEQQKQKIVNSYQNPLFNDVTDYPVNIVVFHFVSENFLSNANLTMQKLKQVYFYPFEIQDLTTILNGCYFSVKIKTPLEFNVVNNWITNLIEIGTPIEHWTTKYVY